MHVLHLDSSIIGDESVGRRLSIPVVDRLSEASPRPDGHLPGPRQTSLPHQVLSELTDASPGADAASGIYDATAIPTTDEIVGLKAARELDDAALRTIFLEARTANGFLDYPVQRELLARAVELALLGPTSANGLPLRLVFIESAEAKEKLRPSLRAGNLEKTMAAPVTAIIATDLKFYERFPRTFPDRGETLKETLAAMEPTVQREFAWDNAVLQMAYFIVALRSLGLDTGPMAGFDRKIVDTAFFPDGDWASQYLINIGYGDDGKLFPRLPRFNVDEIARFA
jgi:3-hydroxypropanoate dehydrogenase